MPLLLLAPLPQIILSFCYPSLIQHHLNNAQVVGGHIVRAGLTGEVTWQPSTQQAQVRKDPALPTLLLAMKAHHRVLLASVCVRIMPKQLCRLGPGTAMRAGAQG